MQEFKFHISLPANSITATKKFYHEQLKCPIGRNSVNWIDINLFGNQLTFIESGDFSFKVKKYKFDDTVIPIFHFGVLLDNKTWSILFDELKNHEFFWLKPTTFLADKSGAHTSFFIQDPNGYVIEFKAFNKQDEVFTA